MANTVQDNNRIAWKYTDKNNVVYAVSAKKVYVEHVTDGTKYGGGAAEASNRRIPKDLKPRRVKCISSGKPDKWMIAYETDATIYTTPGTTLTLNVNGVDATYTTTQTVREEKWRDTTRQST